MWAGGGGGHLHVAHHQWRLSQGVSLHPELDGKLKSGQLTPLALCDILFNGKGFTFGEGYQIINRIQPKPPPKSVINFIVNHTHNNLLNLGVINQQNGAHNVQQTVIAQALGRYATPAAAHSLSERINAVFGASGLTWRVNKLDNAAYQLVPNTTECCVQRGHVHSTSDHSCVYVYRASVVCTCFSHGKQLLQGAASRTLRDLFFDIPADGKGVMVKVVQELCGLARHEGLVRENGSVLRRIGQTHAYAHVSPFREFLRAKLKDSVALKEQPRRFNDLMIYMNNVDSIDFPFVQRDKRYIGFRNGLLDIVNGELVRDDVLEHGVIPRHYIDQPCDFDNLQTPCWTVS